jgi:phage-related protein
MNTVGLGDKEIRVRDAAGAYRAICLAIRAEAVYALHFQKKTRKEDTELAARRFAQIGDRNHT